MPQLGALVVGIGAYRYSSDFKQAPLRYPSTDAAGLIEYFRSCWPESDQSIIVSIDESGATISEIEDGFRKLAADGPYDLQLVFLSGHGVVGAGRSGFLVQPGEAADELALLEPQHLDRILSACKATRTVLILDCCHAEAIVGKMHFFDELQTQVARLYIASSRAHSQAAGANVWPAPLQATFG
jgi:hypothetical protein